MSSWSLDDLGFGQSANGLASHLFQECFLGEGFWLSEVCNMLSPNKLLEESKPWEGSSNLMPS